MKHVKIFPFLFILFLLSAEKAHCFNLFPIKGPHRIFLGPEIYHAKRIKKGGSEQDGWLFGGRAIYERRRVGGFYWAVDGSFANGDLSGKTARGSKLNSSLTDREIEGRLGYCLCIRPLKKLLLVPYGGYGYFRSTNDFKKSSPIPCEFNTSFEYIAAGLTASFFPCKSLECGIDFQAKFAQDGKCKIKNDPEFDTIKLLIEDKIQYEANLPFRYYTCWKNRSVIATFVPFYRFRHYGGKINWPFDFVDTKFKIYGARLLLNIIF